MSFLNNIQNASNWNIGFCETSPEALVSSQKLPNIKWMKHSYRDRFFADPFILDATKTEIRILVEEYIFNSPPGLIVELVIDRKTFCLKQRYEILRLSTHLSYPAIIRKNDEVYVYPENGASGKLNLYRYDRIAKKLIDPKSILDIAVADSTIYQIAEDKYILVATKYPKTQENAFAFESEDFKGSYSEVSPMPFQKNIESSRPAGNFFRIGNKIYRPAQNCSKRYGAGISIMEFDPKTFTERPIFELLPTGYTYSLGLHTLNFHKELCVVDGYGYFYPTLGRIYASSLFSNIRKIFKKLILACNAKH
jgi:hypothetical protein